MTSVFERVWDQEVERVILHVPHYLSYEGVETAGGRQRKVRDTARLIKNEWGRDVLIVQKAAKAFEATDSMGTPVLGVKVPLDVRGDPSFGLATRRLVRPTDGVLTLGQEDAWPFFMRGAKAIHTGVWWDYPHPPLHLIVNRFRTLGLVASSHSVWCVDTNVINWVRCQGRQGFELVSKMEYQPNYVDLSEIGDIQRRDGPSDPVRILFARRYEHKRGGTLFLDALAILKQRGFAFRGILSLGIGQAGSDEVYRDINVRGLQDVVEVHLNSMDSVFQEYAGADIAVIPTLWSEGTSYSCIEAIAAGVPVVVTPVGGLGNLVIPHFNGLISQPVASAMADRLIEAAGPEKWRAMRDNCLSMRQTFSKQDWDARFLRWIRS